MSGHSQPTDPIFVRYIYEIGKKVIINSNPCNSHCQCVWSKKKGVFLERRLGRIK